MNKSSLSVTGWLAVLAISLAAFSVSPALADHKGEPHGNGGGADGGGGSDSGVVDVASSFRDSGADGIESDGRGDYQGEIDKARFSIPLGDLGRNLLLDFGNCVSSDTDDCQPPFGSQTTLNALTWLAVRGSKDENLLQDSMLGDIELRIRFEHGVSKWFLDFNPNIATCEGGVSYIAMDHPDENTWRFFGHAGAVACLQESVRVGRGNKTELQFRGIYNMPFEVTATR